MIKSVVDKVGIGLRLVLWKPDSGCCDKREITNKKKKSWLKLNNEFLI